MRRNYKEIIEIPNDIKCKIDGITLIMEKDSIKLSKKISIPETTITISDKSIIISTNRANRKIIASIKSFMGHIKNMFNGLNKKFIYEMEICNVHFPMNVKVDGKKLIISNFLGEKEKRFANILPGVNVEISGQKIIVSGNDLESTGQTAANIEKSTKITKRDRRIFQDGIFITSKNGREI